MEALNIKFFEQKVTLNSAQTLISISKTKLEKGASTNSSRSSSPVRSYVTRSNADSMKPSTLSYSSANLINVKEHMHCVDDWISNLYPNGYSFSHFKSNFASTIDIEFSIKANNFEGCKTEQDKKDEIENILEIKSCRYPKNGSNQT